jgi:hypothetical protein
VPTANERQHGGDHYKRLAYEHWDFVCDTGQHYLVGCATKYASRWRAKGGIQDLEKMCHYLDKAEERGVAAPERAEGSPDCVQRFCGQLGVMEAGFVKSIMMNEWDDVRNCVYDIKREKRDADAS